MAGVEQETLDNLAWRLAYKKFDELPLSEKCEVYKIVAIEEHTRAISSQTKAIGLVLDHLKGR